MPKMDLIGEWTWSFKEDNFTRQYKIASLNGNNDVWEQRLWHKSISQQQQVRRLKTKG